MKINWVKIDRLAAWLLLILMIIFVVSGYGMTKGIISYQLASSLHLGLLAVLMLVVFTVHTFYAVRLALMRHRWWNNFSKFILILAYALFFIFFTYIGVFYQRPIITANQPVVSNSTSSVDDSVVTTPINTKPVSKPVTIPKPNPTPTPVPSGPRIFTLQELAQYNGQNGQPAYVAVDGIVYDMSIVFRNGDHHGYSAGQDLSSAFHDKHSQDYLSRVPVVGKLQ